MTAIFVMPLVRYLAGRFKVSWDGGSDGGPSQSPRLAREEAEREARAVAEATSAGTGDPDGPVEVAVALSAPSFGRPMSVAARYAGVHDFRQVLAMGECFLWLAESFESLVEVESPAADDRRLVGSAPKLRDELVQLDRLLAQEPIAEELRPGAMLTGPLRDYAEDVQGVRRLIELCTRAAESGLPLIVEP